MFLIYFAHGYIKITWMYVGWQNFWYILFYYFFVFWSLPLLHPLYREPFHFNSILQVIVCQPYDRAEGLLQEVKYQKQVIILLAFIASSGKSGFDVLISSGRNKGVNFLELIMQVLSSGMNTAEIADSVNFEDLDLHKLR